MKIFRAENPMVMKYMFEHLSIEPSTDLQEYAAEILERIVYDPDNTYVSVMFEGDEIQMFIVCYLRENRPWAWIEQCWADASASLKYKNEVLDRVVDWAKLNGKTEIRAATSRKVNDKVAWDKAYGMKPYRLLLRKEI